MAGLYHNPLNSQSPGHRIHSMNDRHWALLFFSWVVALLSTMGSLFFSEVMELPPCLLCWYQRICMYPLVLIYLSGLFPFDRKVFRYSLPLIVAGLGIAIYHNLLYYKILPESAAPCSQGISCTTVQIEWLGFITIPFLSFTAFLILFILSVFQLRMSHEK